MGMATDRRRIPPAGAETRAEKGQLKPMSRTADVRIGTSGWSLPRAAAFRFDPAGTHLQRYSRQLDCAEINVVLPATLRHHLREVA
jgi:hypothetical protein